MVIIDEAHYVQNVQAQRTKLINDLVKNVDRLWLLTGTPMTSRPINYFNLLSLVDSPVAKNWMAYVVRYCSGYQFKVGNRKVWNVMGASHLEELRDRTSSTVLRRLKEDVLDLPDKIITPVYLRLKSKDYEELMGEYFNWYDNNSEESSSLTVQFGKLINACNSWLTRPTQLKVACHMPHSIKTILQLVLKSPQDLLSNAQLKQLTHSEL